MVTRSPRWRVPRVDHEAHFIEATKQAARRAGWLDAFQKGSGLLVRMNRSAEAQEQLARAVETHKQDAGIIGNDETRAAQFARTKAFSYYHGAWWTCTLQNAPPASLSDGDEFYSAQDVREIVQGIRR